MNQIILIGNIVQDLELRVTKSDKQYTFVKLAVRRDKDNTDFIDCIGWEKTAELLIKYAKKGKKIAIQGSLQIDKKNNNGTWIEKHLVVISRVEFCDSKELEMPSQSNVSKEVAKCIHGVEKNGYNKCLDCKKEVESEESILWG